MDACKCLMLQSSTHGSQQFATAALHPDTAPARSVAAHSGAAPLCIALPCNALRSIGCCTAAALTETRKHLKTGC